MSDKATNLGGGKRRVIWFGLLLLVIAGGLSWYISRSREPMYEGKPLTYWLDCYAPLNRTETSVQQADHAIQAIGTNAVPTLLKMLQKTDSPLKMRLIALFRKQHVIKMTFPPASYYQMCAIQGFHALRSDGRQAVPTLIKIFKYSYSPDCRICAIYALTEIGPAAESAGPALVSCLPGINHKELYIIDALVEIRARPEMAVPALMQCLTNFDIEVRSHAVQALGSFGTNAQQAIPAIKLRLKDSDFGTRLYALQALRQIDPQTAAQFEVDQKDAH